MVVDETTLLRSLEEELVVVEEEKAGRVREWEV